MHRVFSMSTTVYTKLIAAGLFLLVFLAGEFWFGVHERHIGAANTQAKWDKQTAGQAQEAIVASEGARATEHGQATAFDAVFTHYLQDTTHAYPSLADSIPAAIASGTLRLSGQHPTIAPTDCGLSAATARSRGADAATTQALADRTESAIRIVRLNDASDAREKLLDAKIAALQSLLDAERNKMK
jgi:hypothetical protein